MMLTSTVSRIAYVVLIITTARIDAHVIKRSSENDSTKSRIDDTLVIENSVFEFPEWMLPGKDFLELFKSDDRFMHIAETSVNDVGTEFNVDSFSETIDPSVDSGESAEFADIFSGISNSDGGEIIGENSGLVEQVVGNLDEIESNMESQGSELESLSNPLLGENSGIESNNDFIETELENIVSVDDNNGLLEPELGEIAGDQNEIVTEIAEGNLLGGELPEIEAGESMNEQNERVLELFTGNSAEARRDIWEDIRERICKQNDKLTPITPFSFNFGFARSALMLSSQAFFFVDKLKREICLETEFDLVPNDETMDITNEDGDSSLFSEPELITEPEQNVFFRDWFRDPPDVPEIEFPNQQIPDIFSDSGEGEFFPNEMETNIPEVETNFPETNVDDLTQTDDISANRAPSRSDI